MNDLEGDQSAPETPPDGPTRCGFVALIGEPNAGKSTLLNRMVGAKVAIVTHKAQTTRARIRGVALEGASQIVFIDTPGLFRPRRRLDRAMVAAAWAGAADADFVCALAEAHRGATPGFRAALEGLDPKQRTVLVVNKIDKVRRDTLLALVEELAALRAFEKVFLISAERGDGAADLKAWLGAQMPEGPWHYPGDQTADLPMRLLAAEITREKLMLRLHEELPYRLTVETEGWTEFKDGSVKVEQVIYVGRDGHKGIVLGKRGETVKAVGAAARAELSKALDRKAHLFLTVRLRPNWEGERERYEAMGLDFSDGEA